MLRESVSIVRQNGSFYMGILVVLYGLPWIDVYFGGSTTGLNVATFFIWSMLALFVQCVVLYGQNVQELLHRVDSPLRRSRGFLWKNFVLSMFSVLVTAAVVIGIHGAQRADNIVSEFLLLASIFYALTLALVGTWLPASIYGRKTSIEDAFGRGRKHLFPMLWRMMVALLGVMVITFIVMLVSVMATTFLGGHQEADLIADNSLNPPILIGTLIATAAHIWCVTYMSIVITRFYMASEGITYTERQPSELAAGH